MYSGETRQDEGRGIGMSTPTRILKFLTMFAVGGTERQFVYLAKSLDRSRFDIRVGCLSREGEFLKDIEAINIPVSEYTIKSLYSPRMLYRQWDFARDLRHQGIRLVHAYGFYPNVFSIPAARAAGCITIASVRDTGVFTSQVKLKTVTQKLACQLADCVVANSSAVRDWLISIGIAENHIRVIPNGITLSGRPGRPTAFPIRRELGIDETAPLVTVISRLNPAKGVDYFLKAIVTVAQQFPDARFLIVGGSYFDPAYKPSLEKLSAELGLQNRVAFTGERNDVPAILQESNISVLPSLSEGFSNSLLEAMAAGLPVIATNVGGNPEIVRDGETGFLVPARDPKALSEAIGRILRSPELGIRFGQAGYERVARNFSLASTVRQTEELYTHLLGERTAKHGRPVCA
jgi:glycosyltransferase involved in cell wall biosynthesis